VLIQSESNGHYLTFNDEEHSYQLDGKIVPGVTSILHKGLPQSPTLVTWMIKTGGLYVIDQLKQFPEQVNKLPDYLLTEIVSKSITASNREARKAANIGSLVHNVAEKIESGVLYDTTPLLQHPEKEKIFNCLRRFEEWRIDNKDEIIGHEEIIASSTNLFGGKFDRLARRGKSVILSDYKTSGAIYANQFIQLAAYAIALEEWKGIEIDGLEILRFGKADAAFETQLIKGKKKIQELKEQFVRCRQTYDFMEDWK
jgi:hypothetical protein